jgi:hypothetical protein
MIDEIESRLLESLSRGLDNHIHGDCSTTCAYCEEEIVREIPLANSTFRESKLSIIIRIFGFHLLISIFPFLP